MAITKMKLARMRWGLTQAELAKKIGVTQPRISAWENGKADIPKARREQIAREFVLDPDTLDQEA